MSLKFQHTLSDALLFRGLAGPDIYFSTLCEGADGLRLLPVAFRVPVFEIADGFFHGPAQGHKVFLDDLPDQGRVDPIVFVSQDVSDRANAGPRLVRCELLEDARKLPRRFGNPQQTALNGVLAPTISDEAVKAIAFGVALDAVEVL
jgi:hypothetical protein